MDGSSRLILASVRFEVDAAADSAEVRRSIADRLTACDDQRHSDDPLFAGLRNVHVRMEVWGRAKGKNRDVGGEAVDSAAVTPADFAAPHPDAFHDPATNPYRKTRRQGVSAAAKAKLRERERIITEIVE